VTVLRVASEIRGDSGGSRLGMFGLPVVPGMLGFDPRCQFVHEDDVVGALVHVCTHDLPGVYNVAADGVLALSEVASLLGKPMLPILPPWGTTLAAAGLRRLGLPIPLETLRELRFGRGLDNRRLKAAGYTYRYTTREALLKLRAHQRLRPLLRSGGDSYRYEREVEEFLRRSPSVQRAAGAAQHDHEHVPGPPPGYDQLPAGEVVGLISSLEPEAAARLRRYEADNLARAEVLEALDRRLARAHRRRT
jgi:UDP-glucose 4-epimerase